MNEPTKSKPRPPSRRSVSGAYSIEVSPSSASGPITIRPRLDSAQVRLPYPSVSADRLYSLPPKPTCQFDLLVLTPIVPARLGQLSEFLERLRRETLSSMQGSPPEHPLLDWALLRTVHYARFVIIEDCPRFGTGPLLAFSTSYDGPLGQPHAGRKGAQKAHIVELVEVAGNALDTIYRCCEGYSGLNNLEGYLASHRQSAATFYVGSSGRPRDQVLAELALRVRVHEVLDELYVAEPQLDPEEVRRRVLADPIIRGIQVPPFPAQPNRTWRFALFVGGLVPVLVAPVAGLFSGVLPLQIVSASMLGTLGLAVFWLRYREQHDPEYEPVYSEPERLHIQDASTDEDVFLQNQLTHLVDMKPGVLRQVLIRAVFLGLQQLARNIYNKGKLGTIPSIHFARWCLIDRGRRLIFFSNFDNSWESYLGDFIDQASSGLTAIWSNTVEYPSTRWLVQAGAEDAGRFKAWTRHYQVRTQVWYSAYPQLSIRNVNANTEIRRGLANPEQMPASVWLDWLQGIDRKAVDALYARERAKSSLGPKPTRVVEQTEPTLALEEVQGLILHGYGPRTGAQYLMLRVQGDKAEKARDWLSRLPLTDAVRGDKRNAAPDPFINVAFTHAGLLALGVREQLLGEFPAAFVEGSAHARRAVINGDLGESGPHYWRWGSGTAEPHVLILVYATTPQAALAHTGRLLGEAEREGLEAVIQLEGGELAGRKEHFGFRDGIAQPAVRGCGGPEPLYNSVAPGEFLLGHPDEYGNIAHSPGGAVDGFGANGSYLVFRQLEQNVAAFWKYCDEQAVRLRLDPVTIAAKLVGRWPSGASLVKHPEADPGVEYQDEDAFAYLADGANNDRSGLACPFGSHLRRTNPRDWDSGATRREAITIANRHRIIRRGRPYGMPALGMTPADLLESARNDSDSAGKRGLQFLAFSADLERQFEFVQQQWSKNPTFAGLSLGPDAINGGAVADWNTGDRCFTLQGDATRSSFGRCTGLSHFVKLIGSAYFFMPSVSAVRKLPGLAAPPP